MDKCTAALTELISLTPPGWSRVIAGKVACLASGWGYRYHMHACMQTAQRSLTHAINMHRDYLCLPA